MTTFIFFNDVFLLKSGTFDKIDGYINDFLSLLPEAVRDKDIEEILDPSLFFSEIISALKGGGARAGSFFLILALSVLVCYLASVYEGKLSSAAMSGACVMALSPLVYELLLLVDEVTVGLSKICSFFSSVIPLVLSVVVAGGGGSTSAAIGAQMSFVASATQVISLELLMPMVRAVIVLSAVSSLGGVGSERLVSIFRLILTRGIGVLTVVVCAIFSLQSIIASAADNAALRLAKFTAQSLAPAVSTIIGASMSTISSGLAYSRGVIGAGAIGAILWIMLSPCSMIIIYRFLIGVAMGVSDALEIKPLSRSLATMQNALDGLLSVFLVSVVLFVFEFIVFIKCGVEI